MRRSIRRALSKRQSVRRKRVRFSRHRQSISKHRGRAYKNTRRVRKKKGLAGGSLMTNGSAERVVVTYPDGSKNTIVLIQHTWEELKKSEKLREQLFEKYKQRCLFIAKVLHDCFGNGLRIRTYDYDDTNELYSLQKYIDLVQSKKYESFKDNKDNLHLGYPIKFCIDMLFSNDGNLKGGLAGKNTLSSDADVELYLSEEEDKQLLIKHTFSTAIETQQRIFCKTTICDDFDLNFYLEPSPLLAHKTIAALSSELLPPQDVIDMLYGKMLRGNDPTLRECLQHTTNKEEINSTFQPYIDFANNKSPENEIKLYKAMEDRFFKYLAKPTLKTLANVHCLKFEGYCFAVTLDVYRTFDNTMKKYRSSIHELDKASVFDTSVMLPIITSQFVLCLRDNYVQVLNHYELEIALLEMLCDVVIHKKSTRLSKYMSRTLFVLALLTRVDDLASDILQCENNSEFLKTLSTLPSNMNELNALHQRLLTNMSRKVYEYKCETESFTPLKTSLLAYL